MSQAADGQELSSSTAATGTAPAVAAPAPKPYDVDEVIKSLKRVPLFMTDLADAGDDNDALEGLRQLAHEGSRAEVAANFREQGNEHARAKNWATAKEFYTRALAALRAPLSAPEEGPPDVVVAERDEQAEAAKERALEEACLANRALCNLELGNYRACTADCAAALVRNPRNVKAWFRSAAACLALDRIPEAEDACARGREVEPGNAALAALGAKISARKELLEEREREKRAREERQRAEELALKRALKGRNYAVRSTDKAPNMEDAAMRLENPLDSSSALALPVLLLYPLHAQSDFIKAFDESHSLGQHLEYILEEPLPWDEQHEYSQDGVECYIETIAGGLIKAGKKLPISKILGSGKVEIVDGLVRVYVVPKARAQEWIEDFKTKRPSNP